MSETRARRFKLAVNLGNIAISLLVVVLFIMCEVGICPVRAPLLVELITWYSRLDALERGAAVIASGLLLGLIVLALLFSFKLHVEDAAVMLLGIPFYLSIAALVFSVAGFVIAFGKLLFGR